MGNSRKQSFKRNDSLVLVRDLTLEDLGYHRSVRSGDVIVEAGATATYLELAITEGNILVSFPSNVYSRVKLGGTGISDGGRWSIDADLFQPAYDPHTIMPGQKFTALLETELFNGNTVPAGTEFLNERSRSRSGVDMVGDIRVSYRSNTTGAMLYNYVRWYKVAPVIVPPPKKLWGMFDEGSVHSFETGKELMVVAVRNVGRRELVRTPSTLAEHERVVGDGNKAFLVQGQIGYIDFVDLRDKQMQKARIWHFDHYFNETDFWNVAVDTIVPLLNQATGKPMTLAEFEGRAEVEAVSGDGKNFIPVGSEVTINGPVYFVVDGQADDEGPRNYAFRDEDEVYILEVERDVDDDDEYALAYKVGHHEDGTGETTWLRPVDLNEDASDFDDECDCDCD